MMNQKHFIAGLLMASLFSISCASSPEALITLEGNPSTGYSWVYDEADLKGIVEEVSSSYSASRSDVIGGGGVFTFTFKGLKEGETTIHFKYLRPWETGVAALNTVDYLIKVNASGTVVVLQNSR